VEGASLQTSYRNVIEKLALVLEHPAPATEIGWLRGLANVFAPLAGVEVETCAPLRNIGAAATIAV
jgi:hypothetical protein